MSDLRNESMAIFLVVLLILGIIMGIVSLFSRSTSCNCKYQKEQHRELKD
jgi:F0F1-type ATP synthase assembly protein I